MKEPKAGTIQRTVLCEYCGTPKTYKTFAAKQSATRHIHEVCLKAEKKNTKDYL